MIDHLRLVVQDLEFEKDLQRLMIEARKRRKTDRSDTWAHTGRSRTGDSPPYFRADKRQAE